LFASDSRELNQVEKTWQRFKDKVSMIDGQSLESLQDKLFAMITSTHTIEIWK
jgi:restriction endonuclease Mrr